MKVSKTDVEQASGIGAGMNQGSKEDAR